MTIRRLSDALVNRIAAGEVVERPAAVVKELVENALDAGASRVQVNLEDGGRARIEVVDDGCGMSREDALVAFERHTTSKLADDEDLFAIRTFGFRGEALSSISSVSKFTLTTRRSEDVAATRIVVEGGVVARVEEAGAPTGTRIEVDELFFNVPARLKFLKTKQTELGHVQDWMLRLALANADKGFSLVDGRRTVLQADATSDGRERIAALLGRDAHGQFFAVEGAHGNVKVTGWAGGPGRVNSNNREIFTFVNGRFVRDRGLYHAVGRAYEGILPIGRSPSVVLFIEMPPDLVDVNVHPQKLEVRFSNGREVYDATVRTLAATLSTSPWLERAAPARTYVMRPASEPAPSPPPAPKQETISAADPEPGPTLAPPLTPVQRRVADALRRHVQEELELPRPMRAADSVVFPVPMPQTPVVPTTPPPPVESRFRDLRYVGQIEQTYLVCEAPDGLVLVDQHAAHERILYERYRAARAGEAVRGQPFLVPLTLELSPSDARAVEAALEELTDLGFELEPFGGQTFLLKAAPAELEGADFARVVVEIALELRGLEATSTATAMEEALLARLACHAAVRAGDPLQPEEARALLEQLEGTPYQAQCPHGRPVAVRFESKRLKELFGRNYEGTPRAAAREKLC